MKRVRDTRSDDSDDSDFLPNPEASGEAAALEDRRLLARNVEGGLDHFRMLPNAASPAFASPTGSAAPAPRGALHPDSLVLAGQASAQPGPGRQQHASFFSHSGRQMMPGHPSCAGLGKRQGGKKAILKSPGDMTTSGDDSDDSDYHPGREASALEDVALLAQHVEGGLTHFSAPLLKTMGAASVVTAAVAGNAGSAAANGSGATTGARAVSTPPGTPPGASSRAHRQSPRKGASPAGGGGSSDSIYRKFVAATLSRPSTTESPAWETAVAAAAGSVAAACLTPSSSLSGQPVALLPAAAAAALSLSTVARKKKSKQRCSSKATLATQAAAVAAIAVAKQKKAAAAAAEAEAQAAQAAAAAAAAAESDSEYEEDDEDEDEDDDYHPAQQDEEEEEGEGATVPGGEAGAAAEHGKERTSTSSSSSSKKYMITAKERRELLAEAEGVGSGVMGSLPAVVLGGQQRQQQQQQQQQQQVADINKVAAAAGNKRRRTFLLDVGGGGDLNAAGGGGGGSTLMQGVRGPAGRQARRQQQADRDAAILQRQSARPLRPNGHGAPVFMPEQLKQLQVQMRDHFQLLAHSWTSAYVVSFPSLFNVYPQLTLLQVPQRLDGEC